MLLNVFGMDRPGLVAEITNILYDHGANLGDVNMTRIGGTFAIILSYFPGQSEKEPIEQSLNKFAEETGVHVSIQSDDNYEGDWGTREADTLITLYGADQPGIVYRVSDHLGKNDINICDLESTLREDQDLYIMALEVRSPDNLSRDQLESDLDEIGNNLDVEINVRPIEPLNT